ncbi:hypothetical protein SAMN04490179_4503 [Pseudomonas antarctica]|uniref:Uncharacterized protein n=1 Tax=Pseudomonas antarctica TaxID=219572 RepID=A0A1H0BVT0_9PSED|nr:hypothetical protein [Pseudomonas antarctica]KAF2406666.1 hypothetical protein PSAN_48430 [Pseudomonas antarctica]SDN49580.1 hypothetical protein SAMN04490179_4503 [Pseudomonas antarctica]
MRVQCPCCGEQFPLEAGFLDDEGKRLAAQFADIEPRLGRAILGYLRLFSPAKRGLRTTRAIKLVEELMTAINAGTVTRDARTAEAKPASPAMWTAGIDQMLAQRERLSLPLDNHHYLRAVVFGIANDPALAAKVHQSDPKKVRSRMTAQQLHQEQIGRINSDVLLGILSKEDGEGRIAALLGAEA